MIEEAFDILDNRRKPLNKKERGPIPGPYPYYGANGVVDHISKWLFDEPLLLLAEDGGHFDEYRTRPIAYLVDGKCWVNNHAHVLRAKAGRDLRWMYYSLVHRDIRRFINSGTRSKLNQADLRSIPVPRPPLPEQRKIAAILSSVDDATKKTQAVIDQVQVVKKGLMQELLTRGLPGRHKRFKKTEIGEIPETWKEQRLADSSAFITSGSRGWAKYYSSTGALFIRSQNVRSGHLDFVDRQSVSPPKDAEGKRTAVAPGDVLITITGNSVGNVACVESDLGEAYVSQHVGLVRLANPSMSRYVALYLAPGAPGNRQIVAAQYGQSKPGLNLGNIRDLKIAVPPDDEREQVVEVLDGVDRRWEAERLLQRQAGRLKSALMSVLLSGEVRVQLDPEAA